MKKRTNIRDVARHAGVSIATVSRILNGTGSFSPRTVAAVERAVKELEYRRSTGSIVRPRSGHPTVDLAISDIDLIDPYFWELLRGLYDTASLQSCGVSLRVFRGLSDDGEGLADDVARSGCDGVIFVPGVATSRIALSAAGSKLPVVFLDRTLEGRTESRVVANSEEGAYQAARYLLKLGHREMVYIGGPQALDTERDKAVGFSRALTEEGITLPPTNRLEGGFERATVRVALSARLKGPRDFSAVFASSDLLAFGAKEALDQAGIAVPGDLSLVGFGNIPFSAALGLTTVEVQAYEMGRNAIHLLLDHLQGRQTETKRVPLTTGLVIRSSCGRRG